MCGMGACVVGVCMHGGMCGERGHAWRGGGHAWQGGEFMGDMRGGHAWQGACMAGGVHGRYYEIRSMSGQYTSYWNVFLF